MTETQQKIAAKEFSARWKDYKDEDQGRAAFWLDLLQNVYGVEQPTQFIQFEVPVKILNTGNVGHIDGYIPETRVLVEQKGGDVSLRKPYKQSDGACLTPFQQGRRYGSSMKPDEVPRWIVACNFQSFEIHNMNRPNEEPEIILLENLEDEYYRLQFLVEKGNEHIRKEMEVSVEAGNIVGKLYDAFSHQFADPESPGALHSLNVLCVRLVFCLYAENGGVFGKYALFHDYMADFKTSQMRKALIELFEILDTKPEDRDPYLKDDNPTLAAFPYVNGGLFSSKEDIEIPPFTEEIRELLLDEASAGFNWAAISPTIFGAVFESTLNQETRRAGGMHYTSIENIHKVIDPLFLNELESEFEKICAETVEKTRDKKLRGFQEKLSSLTFLDPACGSGNFLTESYLSLRRLENRVIAMLQREQIIWDLVKSPIQVSISQFYGIEINDFAVTVAKTALWIAESQMMQETREIVYMDLDFLPLKTNANIREGNALQLDWEDVVARNQLKYIMGNPPFVGARLMSPSQKEDVNEIFSGWKNVGDLDYVCCWYKKTADMIERTSIRAALVSTNSVTQGESVANLWKPLMEKGVHIDFAHRTFRWDSEASIKAHVHCVIVGFSVAPYAGEKTIYTDERAQIAKNINGYLVDAENIFIESRKKPICDVPEIGIGNMPIDDGNYLFSKEEMLDFIKKEPASEKYFKPWYGSQEFINQKPRYCLWLGTCTPEELLQMPKCMERVEAVRKFRSGSKRPSTKKLADSPTIFGTTSMPQGAYILIPRVSSERRKYVPMGFMSPDKLSSDSVHIIPGATLYHFGVLVSNVHMAWMRAVCGRLKSDYRYSKEVVYNNFPWPNSSPEQKLKIEQTAQKILDARELYPNCSLADMYGENMYLFPELVKAHTENDRAVLAAYGWTRKDAAYSSQSACVAELMKIYQRLCGE